VHKTTVYLPGDLKRSLEQMAATSGRSEADLIREAIRSLTRASRRRRPHGRLFASRDATLSERIDEALSGFGKR
jgi:Arc/MetJ-type ribon-helix-helix transcriptional regulator